MASDKIREDPDAQEVVSITLNDLVVRNDDGHGALSDALQANMGNFSVSLSLA